ncbi:hypothetical protein QBC44DRAFT_335327 [Cladorrhinum sp. PSN332]|nr:hypothetical protein QBC44DRAFT_335327 [Cladorrhinum sp. PSN332]
MAPNDGTDGSSSSGQGSSIHSPNQLDQATILKHSVLTDERLKLLFYWFFFGRDPPSVGIDTDHVADLAASISISTHPYNRGILLSPYAVDQAAFFIPTRPVRGDSQSSLAGDERDGTLTDTNILATRIKEAWPSLAHIGELSIQDTNTPEFAWSQSFSHSVLYGAAYLESGTRTVFLTPGPSLKGHGHLSGRNETPSHGKIWTAAVCGLYQPTTYNAFLPLPLFVFVANICQSIGVLPGDCGPRQSRLRCPFTFGFRFLHTYAHPQEPRWSMTIRSTHDLVRAKYETILQFHLRRLSNAALISPLNRHIPGVHLKRQEACIPVGGEDGSVTLKEAVLSASLSILNTDAAPYTIVMLVDKHPARSSRRGPFHLQLTGIDSIEAENLYLNSILPSQQDLEEYSMQRSGRCFGVTQFHLSVIKLLEEWEHGWIQALRGIDQAVQFRLGSTLNNAELDEFMFDDSFDRSRCYFAILQTLRTSSDMVDEALADWTELRNRWNIAMKPGVMFSAEDLKALEQNWNVVSDLITAMTNRLQGRINRKTEEVKSLRDGLFNATSLREATKAIALNRAIYVFTVVTVIYTPIGFLATFWALPYFNSTTPDSAITSSPSEQPIKPPVPSGFVATFIVVPLLTYTLCIFVAYCLGFSTNERRALNRRISGMPGALKRRSFRIARRYNSLNLIRLKLGSWWWRLRQRGGAGVDEDDVSGTDTTASA